MIHVQEVALRDGLQSEAGFMPTEKKIKFVDRLAASGLSKIEVSSFVSPRAVPQLADAEAVFQGITRLPGVIYAALVPNVRGLERAIAARADEVNLVMSASESHNRANLRMSCDASFQAIKEAASLAANAGLRVAASLSCSFGCPFEGEMPAATILMWCHGCRRRRVSVRLVCATRRVWPIRRLFMIWSDSSAQHRRRQISRSISTTRGDSA